MTENLEKLKNLKKVKSFDIDEFDGVKSVIESVELSEIKEADFGDGKIKTQQIVIKSSNLADNDVKPIHAVEYISLKYDSETEEFGIPENPNSNAMKFLKYFKVNSFEELLSKSCMIVKRQKEKGEFLGIHYG